MDNAALKAYKDQCTSVSIVHVKRKNPGEEGIIKVFISKTSSHFNGGVVEDSFILPKYDMSLIPLVRNSDLSQKENGIYLKIMLSQEGRAALNEIKNNRTTNLVNEYLEIENKNVAIGRSGSYKSFIAGIMSVDFNNEEHNINNMLSFKTLGLTKRQIFDKFVEMGLTDKYKKHETRTSK